MHNEGKLWHQLKVIVFDQLFRNPPQKLLMQAFFQHFRENSTAKKTQFLPYLKKLKAIFGPKLKVGAAFI